LLLSSRSRETESVTPSLIVAARHTECLRSGTSARSLELFLPQASPKLQRKLRREETGTCTWLERSVRKNPGPWLAYCAPRNVGHSENIFKPAGSVRPVSGSLRLVFCRLFIVLDSFRRDRSVVLPRSRRPDDTHRQRESTLFSLGHRVHSWQESCAPGSRVTFSNHTSYFDVTAIDDGPRVPYRFRLPKSKSTNAVFGTSPQRGRSLFRARRCHAPPRCRATIESTCSLAIPFCFSRRHIPFPHEGVRPFQLAHSMSAVVTEADCSRCRSPAHDVFFAWNRISRAGVSDHHLSPPLTAKLRSPTHPTGNEVVRRRVCAREPIAPIAESRYSAKFLRPTHIYLW